MIKDLEAEFSHDVLKEAFSRKSNGMLNTRAQHERGLKTGSNPLFIEFIELKEIFNNKLDGVGVSIP